MDHPLVHEEHKGLRKRVVQFLKTAYSAPRRSNIVFVCGGNNEADMRIRFRSYCLENLTDYEIFFPEFAMKNYFSEEVEEPFDIADFEELVGEISSAIVVFPEAAGSFAETGYFSAIESIAKQTILVLDSQFQSVDSFISLGPARKIETLSHFHPLIQTSYDNPDFPAIVERIQRVKLSGNRKTLVLGEFRELSTFELFLLTHEVVNVLSIATIEDILFVFRALFKAQISSVKIKQVTSVLVGSENLKRVGQFGHYSSIIDKAPMLTVRRGKGDAFNEIRLGLTSVYAEADADFLDILREAGHVD